MSDYRGSYCIQGPAGRLYWLVCDLGLDLVLGVQMGGKQYIREQLEKEETAGLSGSVSKYT